MLHEVLHNLHADFDWFSAIVPNSYSQWLERAKNEEERELFLPNILARTSYRSFESARCCA
jgi:hypothetical protein